MVAMALNKQAPMPPPVPPLGAGTVLVPLWPEPIATGVGLWVETVLDAELQRQLDSVVPPTVLQAKLLVVRALQVSSHSAFNSSHRDCTWVAAEQRGVMYEAHR